METKKELKNMINCASSEWKFSVCLSQRFNSCISNAQSLQSRDIFKGLHFLMEVTLRLAIKRKNCFLFLFEIYHLLLMWWKTANSNSLFNIPMLFMAVGTSTPFPFCLLSSPWWKVSLGVSFRGFIHILYPSLCIREETGLGRIAHMTWGVCMALQCCGHQEHLLFWLQTTFNIPFMCLTLLSIEAEAFQIQSISIPRVFCLKRSSWFRNYHIPC